MKVLIVFAHPYDHSFTSKVLDSFVKGLMDAGHTFEVSDLYKMNFRAVMTPEEYEREGAYRTDIPIPEDVKMEQDKIKNAQAIVFIYPVWWSDCPAILKGWFDRVFNLGFAYAYENSQSPSILNMSIKKALAICTAGHPIELLEELGIDEGMRNVMLNDRLLAIGADSLDMEILAGMAATNDKEAITAGNLKRAYTLGKGF